MRISLNQTETRELRSFFTERQNKSGTISLSLFLESVGLPAQTIGFGSILDQPVQLLTNDELQKCQRLVNTIRHEFERMRIKPTFPQGQDKSMKPYLFMQELSKQLGPQFL